MNTYNQPDRLNWKPLDFRDLAASTLANQSESNEIVQAEVNESQPDLEPELDSQPELNTVSSELAQTQQTLEQLKQEVEAQAYQEGFNLGREAGFEEGKRAGYEQGYLLGQQEGRKQIEQQLNDEKCKTVHAITNLISNFQQSINDIDELIVPKLFDLALIAAQKTVGSIAKVKQKQLIHTIQTLVEQCSILSEPMSLHLNPTDLQWLEPMLNEENQQYRWQLIADPNIEIGGCKILTNTNEIDASVNNHWQIMSGCLQRDNH
ncbi:flagellar assembly protein FliH [Gilliamella bombicola]|uniref:Flagellar assembly protein FliH n=1 Tax=Gilliamella bombicola TaxID=1798182 RepID=A0A1C4BA79_9GAMM|nr:MULTISPECIES: flagellar assembly protein FliH [Gilliamella]NUF27920.1 flagellar assembly protein FliH [Gilliamella sp. ESL0254]SCC03740.1 flagellar assembly protein FliH [Gilliamella bombicola]